MGVPTSTIHSRNILQWPVQCDHWESVENMLWCARLWNARVWFMFQCLHVTFGCSSVVSPGSAGSAELSVVAWLLSSYVNMFSFYDRLQLRTYYAGLYHSYNFYYSTLFTLFLTWVFHYHCTMLFYAEIARIGVFHLRLFQKWPKSGPLVSKRSEKSEKSEILSEVVYMPSFILEICLFLWRIYVYVYLCLCLCFYFRIPSLVSYTVHWWHSFA